MSDVLYVYYFKLQFLVEIIKNKLTSLSMIFQIIITRVKWESV
jgi:hypothetical protein